MDAKELGRLGEVFAAGWLEANGYTLLARNWRCRAGELDLVALEAGDLVGVEVKTRAGDGFGHPAEAVTSEKLLRLHRLVRAYAGDVQTWRFTPRRVDVMALLWPVSAPSPTAVEYFRDVAP